MKNNYLEWNGIMWNKLVFFWIKMNEQECSRSVPIRNVPLHRKDFGGLGEQSEDLHVWWIQIHYEVYWGGVRVCVCQWQYIEMDVSVVLFNRPWCTWSSILIRQGLASSTDHSSHHVISSLILSLLQSSAGNQCCIDCTAYLHCKI